MADDRHSWEVRVSGCVQGVFYRAHTREAAMRLGVVGWVRNEPDGTVRALIQHHNSLVLTDLVSIMRQGPPGAMVAECDVTPVQGTAEYERFEILR